MPLTDSAIRNTKPVTQAQRRFDGAGLYLEMAPSGGRWWRLKYRFGGKKKRLSLGTYPDTSLKAARDRRDQARQLLAAGTDPGEQRKADKLQTQLEAKRAFKRVALAWLDHQTARWTPTTKAAVLAGLEADACPILGPMSINDIRARHGMEVVRKVEARGVGETAARLLQRIRSVFRFVVRESWIDLDVARWRVPAERMKMRTEHLLPLSRQAVDLLRTLEVKRDGSALLFPSPYYPGQALSENTVNSAHARMGYEGTATAHGLRALFSTVANECGHDPDVIERQRAHVERNQVRAAHHRST